MFVADVVVGCNNNLITSTACWLILTNSRASERCVTQHAIHVVMGVRLVMLLLVVDLPFHSDSDSDSDNDSDSGRHWRCEYKYPK